MNDMSADMKRHIYMDESWFADPSSHFGYVALATDAEIDGELILVALKKLESDPDRHKPPADKHDAATLSRGYFHATDDSKNAHAWLCREISSRVSGKASCQFQDRGALPDGRDMTDAEFDGHVSTLSYIAAMDTPCPLHLVFEQRNGLTEARVRSWHENLEHQIMLGCYDQPWIPTYFPAVEVTIGDKSVPGLQCADFILWAVNRHANGDSAWVDRLKFNFRSEMTTETGYWGGMTFDMGAGLSDSRCAYSVTDFPTSPDREVDSETMCRIYLNAEYVLWHLVQNGFPENTAHLRDDVIAAEAGRLRVDSGERVEEVAKLTLRLFDQVPLIGAETTQKDKKFLLLSRKYLALTLRKDLINGTRTLDYLRRARGAMLKDPKAPLDFGK